jgi:fucose permease
LFQPKLKPIDPLNKREHNNFEVIIIGLSVANIWPLVFSIAVEKYPTRTNEILGLMMMAISGGAVIPLLIGWVSDLSSVAFGMSILIVCMIYLLSVSVYSLKK